MKKYSLGFIGGGRITKIFLQAFQNKGLDLSDVVVCDTNAAVLHSLHLHFAKIQVTDSPELAARQDIVFIAVHPPVMMEALTRIKGDISAKTTIVSLAPKIDIGKITAALNHNHILRVIPNATSYINEGYNPYCYSSAFPEPSKTDLNALMDALGHAFEVPENKLEIYAVLSAMLPTYFWFQWKELQDIGLEMGLTDAECHETLHETLSASLNLMFSSEIDYPEVADLIPVKPIADHETYIRDAYRNKLISLFEKLKPSF